MGQTSSSQYGKKVKKKVTTQKKKKPSKCKKLLQQKIALNIKEYNNGGRYSSREQAIAVAYSQVKKSNPHCKRWLK